MRRLSIAVALVLALGVSGPVRAEHWSQTADPQVVQALNELTGLYGGYCQQGNPQACQMLQAVQQHGAQMLNAGYDCQMNGNPQACQFYNTAYQSLAQTYQGAQQAMMQGQVQQQVPYNDGTTHEQRMQQIHDWGQQRLDWGQQQSDMMDRSHEQFMETLRE